MGGFGVLLPQLEITPVGRNETRGLSRELLCDIMQPRALELLQHIAGEVASVRAQISSGVVLTGGGSLARGMVDVAEQVFDAPTRLGYLEPSYFGGLYGEVQTPDWAVASGLALSSMKSQLREYSNGHRGSKNRVAEWIGNFRQKLR